MSQSIKFKSLGEIKVGGIPHEDLIPQARKGGNILLTPWAIEILGKTAPLWNRESVEVVAVKLRLDLPVKSKDKGLRPMYDEAFEHGLCLCPTALALEILFQKRNGFAGQTHLAMKPVTCSGEELGHQQDNILSIMDKKSPWGPMRSLNGTHGDLDGFMDGGMTYLFCVQTPTLVSEGYASLT